MDFLAQLIDIIGVSFLVAVVTGMSLGLYLAAIHSFVPIRSLRRSLITDAVIGLSFFLPLAIQRVVTESPTLGPVAWTGFTVLWLAFAFTADTMNYVICRWKQGRFKKKLQD